MTYLKVDAKKCIGCRACEIACSYHHRRVFNPRIASLEIRTEEKWPGISIVLYKDMPHQQRVRRFPCDYCQEEPIALCAKYCPVGAIKSQNRGSPFQ